MSTMPELARLFTELALDLRRSHPAADVSSLRRSLDPDDEPSPRVSVLDAALSLMGFKHAEVSTSRIECLVRTIVSVLSSSVCCRVLRSEAAEAGELLMVGSSISSMDCYQLVRECATVSETLEKYRGTSTATMPFGTLLYAVLKVAVSSSSFHMLSSSSPTFQNEEPSDHRRTAISKLAHLLPDEMTVGSNEIPSRLLLWYLDPMFLKHDISEILKETIRRPFLCLKEQLRDRVAWRSIIVCLVTSPTMFIETGAVLYKWFVVTCSPAVLDLQIALLSALLDVLSRPMWWGVSKEWGLKYPFCHAYFPKKYHELLAVLSGHISCRRFLDLVSCLGIAFVPAKTNSYASHSSPDTFGHDTSMTMEENISFWAMVLQFPVWLHFATILIFSQNTSQDSHLCTFIYGEVKTEAITDTELQQAATYFLSWVLSPNDQSHHRVLVHQIHEISKSWMTKCRSKCSREQKLNSDTRKKITSGRSKKLRIPKVDDYEKLRPAEDDDTGSTIRAWLKEYDAVHAMFCKTAINKTLNEAKVKQNAKAMPRLLYLKVPLGIFISSSSYLNEEGAELLLHYVATGEIIEFGEMHQRAEGYVADKDLSYQSALYGASFVFTLFDILEDMSAILFDKEDSQVDFFCQLKSKASRYLHRCVTILLTTCHIQNDEVGGREIMADLFSRLKKWMLQGREEFDGFRTFKDVLDDLARINTTD